MPLVLLLLVPLLAALDLALKSWARANLEGVNEALVPGLVSLTLTFNTGAAWSLFSNAALPLALLRLLVGLGIVMFLWRRPAPILTRVGLVLVAGGALGNAFDGLLYGRVTDMLASPVLSTVTRAVGQGDFPIFNLADVWVVSGVLVLLGGEFAKRGGRRADQVMP